MNQLNKTEETESFWRYIFMQAKIHKILEDSSVFIKKGENIDQTQAFMQQLLSRHILMKKRNHNIQAPTNFLKKGTKA